MQYLAANPDVMQNAKEQLAIASRDNERLRTNPIGATSFIENVAREHYLNFGKQEGREGFGIIDPRMKNFANIMANTYDMDDPGTEGGMRPEFNTGVNTIEDFAKYTSGINQNLYDRLIDRFDGGSTNEDKAPGRVDEVMRFMFTPNRVGNTGFEIFGGNEALFEAYDQIGITGEGESYADKQARDLLELAKKYNIETLSPDINVDGTGGSEEITLGGPTGTGYDSVQQMIADMPNAFQQAAAVPTVNPLALLNTFRAMYTGDINRNPYDTSDQTGTRKDRSVPSPMEFNAPTQEQLFQQMDKLQFNSPGYPGLTSGDEDDGPFGGIGSGGGGE
tara:strand:- start:170 stop:1171 length:1002 start_codon:yes stop_codon:yes gene_type:complete